MFSSSAAVCSPKTAPGTSCYPSSGTKHCTQWTWDGHLLFFNSFVSSPPGNGLSAQISDACCSFPFCLWWSCPCNCLCQHARRASRSQLQQEDVKADLFLFFYTGISQGELTVAQCSVSTVTVCPFIARRRSQLLHWPRVMQITPEIALAALCWSTWQSVPKSCSDDSPFCVLEIALDHMMKGN